MTFSQKVDQLRSRAQETQAALKIIDMLTKLKLGNDETTYHRWVWELIQNAKDIVNSSGKVDIVINFDVTNRLIEFKHNGKLFTTENIVFLIEQVSTKDREAVSATVRKTTGKFGTGFLTTHLLSEKVKISGCLQDDDEQIYSFSVVLDRSGKDKQSIIDAIKRSCDELDKNTSIVDKDTINESNFNTCFTYQLNDTGIETAKKGLKELFVSAPYVFAFVPEINSITVTSGENYRKIVAEENIEPGLDNSKVVKTLVSTNKNNETEAKYIFVCGTQEVSVAAEIIRRDGCNYINKYHSDLPKIFCDFPLLGTNDFSFPVVVNSSFFNPTEPRNGIHLTDKDHAYVMENKNNMSVACQLFIKMIDYFLDADYEGIYNIVKLPIQFEKDWIDQEWFDESILKVLKEHLRIIPMITTHSGIKIPLFDDWGDCYARLLSDNDAEMRKQVWTLSSAIIPDKISRIEDLEYWYDSLWDECRNYNISDLIVQVENFESLQSLADNGIANPIKWINVLINLLYKEGTSFINDFDRHPKILPNQYGDFCTFESISCDIRIDDKYKEISLIIDIDIKSRLLDKRISGKILDAIGNYKADDLFREISQKLQYPHTLERVGEFYKEFVCLYAKNNAEQNEFIALSKIIDIDFNTKTNVSVQSEYILKSALRYWREELCKQIDSCESILCLQTNTPSEPLLDSWLSDFVQHLIKYGQENLLEQLAILPNQNGDFKKVSELSLDSGEIPEILKDACNCIGYDVRERLLLMSIFLKLHESRTIYLSNISDNITQYVKDNRNAIGRNSDDEKMIFQKVYLWLRDNQNNATIKKCFSDLVNNLHWFYNDNDIAHNMHMVEEYHEILKKYSVSGLEELEKILARSIGGDSEKESVEISEELLLQFGITNENDLQRALANNILGGNFIHTSSSSPDMFIFVTKILKRARDRIIDYLSKQPEYDVAEVIELSETIFGIKKHGSDICVIARPSDYGDVILYYETERDLLDYEKDCELWVEDGKNDPQKITFGKILKLTGVNRIPLRSVSV